MQLSKRLQAIAELVTRGNTVADVGCDHAYISIYLAENRIAPYIIAMDINQGPIDRAKENVIKYQCTDRVDVRKSNGLEKLRPGEADTILIAGMGGALMVQILTQQLRLLKSVQELILQPQSEIYKVREMLSEHHFVIVKEEMMKEENKYYVMMKAVPMGQVEDLEAYLPKRKEHMHYGRLLLEQRNTVLKEFLIWDLGICKEILQALMSEKSEHALKRKKDIEDRIVLIESGLSCYTQNQDNLF